MKANKDTGSLVGTIRATIISVLSLVAICSILNATKVAVGEVSLLVEKAESVVTALADKDVIFVCRFEIVG